MKNKGKYYKKVYIRHTHSGYVCTILKYDFEDSPTHTECMHKPSTSHIYVKMGDPKSIAEIIFIFYVTSPHPNNRKPKYENRVDIYLNSQ